MGFADKQVSQLLEYVRGRKNPPLSGRGYLLKAIELANARVRDSRDKGIALVFEILRGEEDQELTASMVGISELVSDGWPIEEQVINGFVSDLDLLARSHRRGAGAKLKQLARQRLIDIGGKAPPMVIVPILGDRGDVIHRYFAETLDAALRYARILLADKAQGIGNNLGRCGLEECAKFFLAEGSRSGGPPRLGYCSASHAEEAHARDAAHRMARKRKADRRANAGKRGAQ